MVVIAGKGLGVVDEGCATVREDACREPLKIEDQELGDATCGGVGVFYYYAGRIEGGCLLAGTLDVLDYCLVARGQGRAQPTAEAIGVIGEDAQC